MESRSEFSQERHAPRTGLFAVVESLGPIRESAVAVTRMSAPAFFCNSPIASMSAILALLRAVDMANAFSELRSEMDDSDNRPTARIVSRIMRLSVTTRANPCWLLMGGATMDLAFVFMGSVNKENAD